MELDQRVKALEYEIKILKNEIQRTLLDIQEQVLIHYYPTLRSDDSLPPEAIAQAFSAKQAAAASPAAVPASAPTPIPAVKRVSLEDIRAQSEPAAALTAAARTGSDQSIMVNLSEWISTNAPKIGGERIGKIVEVCGNKGIIPAETKAVLMRIASLSKDAAPDQVPVNEILNTLLKLDGVLGRAADVEEALVLIEEAQLDKTIVTALLIIAGVISAIFVFNAIYPAIQQSGDAMTSMERRIDDRMKSQVQIIHAARKGDDAVIWIKNVGSTRIVGLENGSDLFFGPEGNFVRLPYGGTATPHWSYTIENDSEWKPSATIKITISGFTFLAPGTRYFVKIVTPIGIGDELYFSE